MPMAKRYDDDDDDDLDDLPSVKKKQPLSGMDGFFANTNIVVLVIFALCCNGIALILGIIGLVTCKDPQAKSNATIVTVIGGIMTVVGVVLNVLSRSMH
jgi:hypothetical protein